MKTRKEAPTISTNLNLDAHQARMVAFLRERLGGTTDEALEFLVTAGLYAIQLDAYAEGRVRDGVGVLYGDSEIPTGIMSVLTDLECSVKNDLDDFMIQNTRPRMAGDWRGEPVPDEPEAGAAEA